MSIRLVSFRGRLVLSLAAAVLLAVAGCGGSDGGTVHGTLLHKDGTPLVGAKVVIRSADTGKSSYGTTDAKGEFQIGLAPSEDESAPGNYDVAIIENRGDVDNRRKPTIAAKYRDAAASGLNVNVKAGESKDLQLTLDPP